MNGKFYIVKDGEEHKFKWSKHKPENFAFDAPLDDEGKQVTRIDDVEFIDEKPVFSKKKREDRLAKKQARIDQREAEEYKFKRRSEYPSVGDQLDALYKKLHLNDSKEYDALAAKISEIKKKYPKPE